jgi:hypothetical protein
MKKRKGQKLVEARLEVTTLVSMLEPLSMI